MRSERERESEKREERTERRGGVKIWSGRKVSEIEGEKGAGNSFGSYRAIYRKMSVWNYVVTAHKPTNVTHSCVGNFTSPQELNLIIA